MNEEDKMFNRMNDAFMRVIKAMMNGSMREIRTMANACEEFSQAQGLTTTHRKVIGVPIKGKEYNITIEFSNADEDEDEDE